MVSINDWVWVVCPNCGRGFQIPRWQLREDQIFGDSQACRSCSEPSAFPTTPEGAIDDLLDDEPSWLAEGPGPETDASFWDFSYEHWE